MTNADDNLLKILYVVAITPALTAIVCYLFFAYLDWDFMQKCMERHQDMEYEEAIQYCEETLAEMREID